MTHDSTHSRRWLWLSTALLVLPALALWLVHSWLGWEGERLWQQAQARLKAEGETLDFMALVPKPVPDEDNFFAIEPLKDIALVVDGDETKGEPGARRARIEALKLESGNGEGDYPKCSGINHGVKWDVKGWADYYRTSERLPMPPDSGEPGRDLLAALAQGNDVYAELHQALGRSYSRITPERSARESYRHLAQMPLMELNVCQTLTQTLALRAQSCVASGEVLQAVNDTRTLARLAEGAGQEPTIIQGLVAVTLVAMLVEPTWSLLEARGLDAATLMRLQTDLARLDMNATAAASLRGELAFQVDTIDWLVEQDDSVNAYKLGAKGSPKTPRKVVTAVVNLALWHLNPDGVAQGNKAACVQGLLEYHLQPLKVSGLHACLLSSQRYEADVSLGKTANGVMATCAQYSGSVYSSIIGKMLLSQARLHQARLACALERYFLQHQRYPEKLNELVPAFIDKVLLDPCDDKPMRYARTPAGRYKLWSLGFDGEDDGGKVIASPQDAPSHPKLSARDYPGDWVWSYERLVPLEEP